MSTIYSSSGAEFAKSEEFLGNLTQKERETNNQALEAVIKYSIHTLFPDADIRGCAENIDQGYGDNHRAFHTKQHIFQVLPPIIQQKIADVQHAFNKGSPYEGLLRAISEEEKQLVISAAYHDVKYHIDDTGIRDISASLASKGKLKEASETGGNGNILKFKETNFSDIREELISRGFRENEINCIQELFGIKGDAKFTQGKMNSALKIDGAPMNEFLSALTAMRDIAPGGIESLTPEQKKNLFQTVIDIQMTVPFQQNHARHLFENAVRVMEIFGVSDRVELVGMVNHAVDMSNRDIGNLLHKDFIHMLYGDYVIAAEFRPDGRLNNDLPISDLYNSVTSPGFAIFVMRPAIDQNRLAQPSLAEDGYSLLINSSDYIKMKDNAAKNLRSSLLCAEAMGAALTVLCVGGKEADRLCGYQDKDGVDVYDEGKKRHLMSAVKDCKILSCNNPDLIIIPEGLAGALDFVLERYSVSQLETLRKEGHSIVTRAEHKDKTLAELRMPDMLSPEITYISQSSKLSAREKLRNTHELDQICQSIVSKESVCRIQSGTVSSVSSIVSNVCRSIGNAINSCFHPNRQDKRKVSPDLTITERTMNDSRGM